MAAHVLVLANVTASSGDLIDAIRQRAEKGPIDVTLLMPGQGPGLAGREAVRGPLDDALAAWREAGIEADGICGDADPMDAVAETWDPRRHDEVSSRRCRARARAGSRATCRRVARLTGAPVTHVVANDMRPEPTSGRRRSTDVTAGAARRPRLGPRRLVARAGCPRVRGVEAPDPGSRSSHVTGAPAPAGARRARPGRPRRPTARGAPSARRERILDADVQLRSPSVNQAPPLASIGWASPPRAGRAARRRRRAPPLAAGRRGDLDVVEPHAATASSSVTCASSWPASHAPTIRASTSSSAGSQPPRPPAPARRAARAVRASSSSARTARWGPNPPRGRRRSRTRRRAPGRSDAARARAASPAWAARSAPPRRASSDSSRRRRRCSHAARS